MKKVAMFHLDHVEETCTYLGEFEETNEGLTDAENAATKIMDSPLPNLFSEEDLIRYKIEVNEMIDKALAKAS